MRTWLVEPQCGTWSENKIMNSKNIIGVEFDIMNTSIVPENCSAVIQKFPGGKFKILALCLNRSMAIQLSDLLNSGRGQRMTTMAIERQGKVWYRGNYSFPNIINATAELENQIDHPAMDLSEEFMQSALPPYTDIVRSNSFPSRKDWENYVDQVESGGYADSDKFPTKE